ncbi:MAG: TrmH family RNA methyltransferase [Acidimicrobiales bacterium]
MIEGWLALEAALASPYELLSVLVLKRRSRELEGLPMPARVPVYAATRQVMNEVAGFDVHRGLLAAAARLPPLRVAELLAGGLRSPVVVVEGVNDQENLGSLFRNCAAFGVGAVLMDPTCADPLYRRTVRVSLGWVLRVPFARLEPWPGSLGLLAAHGFALLALTPRPGAETVEQVSGELWGQKVALVVGSERHGLTCPVLEACRPVRVPMAAGVDSLNVAAASAVALHRFSSV